MNNTALADQLIQKIRTTSELAQVRECFERFLDTFLSLKSEEEKGKIFQDLPKELSSLLISTFAPIQITPENYVTTKQQIDSATDKLRTCKTIHMTIAFKPDEATITLFSDWIKKNVSPTLLLELNYDATIVGGVQLIAGGVFKDYSVRKNLANRFQIQREEITELLS